MRGALSALHETSAKCALLIRGTVLPINILMCPALTNFIQNCEICQGTVKSLINTLRTGDANLRFLRFCVTTVKDG
jgi:hypothetical protein